MSDFEDALIKNAGNGEVEQPEPTAQEQTTEVAAQEEEIVETPAGVEEPNIEETDDSTETEAPSSEDSGETEEPPTVESDSGVQDSVFEDWDVDEPQPEETPGEAGNVDASSVLKELGLEGLTLDQAKSKVSELQETASTDAFADLPDNLKQAVQLAKNDGDWLQYLGVTSVDYSKVDDNVLLANSLAKYFTNPEGTVDKEALSEYIDMMDDKDRQIRAQQIRDEVQHNQQMQKQELERQAEQRRAEADTQLRQSLQAVEDIRGFKLTAANKKKIYDGISSGDMIKEMFQDKSGNWDWPKVIKSYFNHLYGDKADSYMKQRITSSTKKEILNKLSNVQVEAKPSELPDVSPETYSPQRALANELIGN